MYKDLNKKTTISFINAIGSILAPLAVIIASYSTLTPVFKYIIILLLCIIAAISIYVVIGSRIVRFVNKVNSAKRNKYLCQRLYFELDKHVDILEQLFNVSITGNIVDSISKIAHVDRELHDIELPIHDFYNLYISLRYALTNLQKNVKNFEVIIRWYDSILRIYHEELVCKPIRKIRLYSNKITIEDKLRFYNVFKEEYNKSRTIYNDIIISYMKFTKEVNKSLNRQITTFYFNLPDEL